MLILLKVVSQTFQTTSTAGERDEHGVGKVRFKCNKQLYGIKSALLSSVMASSKAI